MGNSGLIAEHVVRSLSDSIAAGQSPARALGMEMGRITEAMAMFAQTTDTEGTGKLAKFASFMGGPWGLAVSVGVAVLVPLISELVELGSKSDDAMQKLREEALQTDVTRTAKERFKTTVEGVTEAIHAGTDATNKSIEAEKSAAEQANVTAKREFERELQIRRTTVALLERAKADTGAANAQTFGAAGGAGAGMAQSIYAARQGDAQKAADDAKRGLAEAEARVQNTRIDLAAEAASRAANPLEQIKKLYDDKAHAAEDAARREIAAGRNITSALTAQLAGIERQRKAATEAEQERERLANRKPNDRQVGRQIDLGQAEDIIHGIGGRITSTTRTREQQQGLYDRYQAYKGGTGPWAPLAAKPGTSEHESGQALDIAMGGGMSLAKIRAAFEKNGVRITELLNEGDHFHVAWGKKGPSQETLEKREQAAADKRTRDSEA